MPPRDADEWGLPEGYDESDDFCIKNTPGRPGVLHFKDQSMIQEGVTAIERLPTRWYNPV